MLPCHGSYIYGSWRRKDVGRGGGAKFNIWKERGQAIKREIWGSNES